jgi:hypothetical protein
MPSCSTWRANINSKLPKVPVAWAHRDGTRMHPFRDGIHMYGFKFVCAGTPLVGNITVRVLRRSEIHRLDG